MREMEKIKQNLLLSLEKKRLWGSIQTLSGMQEKENSDFSDKDNKTLR